jgi:peptide/bleomycin uptake transporter
LARASGTHRIRLLGLQFRNQRVEAAYRKELVYAEDDETRAQPDRCQALCGGAQELLQALFNYMYFNIGRILYLQTDNIFLHRVAPTIVAGHSSALNQILNASPRCLVVQYLVDSWTTIVELLSIYKRLRPEAALQRRTFGH